MKKGPSLKFMLKHRWLPFLYGYLAKAVLNVIGMTCTFHLEGLDFFRQTASKKKCLLFFWHNRLSMFPIIANKFTPELRYAALISQSRDGEIISTIAESYSKGRAIRIPHNSKSEALRKMIREWQMSDEIFVITPDGPQGPAYQVKPGAVMAAKKVSATIFPLSWTASRYWTFNTWDQFMLPKPFSTIRVTFGSPLDFSRNNQDNWAEEAKILQEALSNLS
ncbi:MAG: lysophospholipid acyltransferase family protein [Waddliaceae bacterium]